MAFQKEGMGQGLSGKLGGVVYRRSGDDTIACRPPTRVDPNTPGQAAARQRMDWTIALWAALPLESIERWRAWAASPSPLDRATGGAARSRRASGYSAFRGLAAKYMHLHGGTEAPAEPPTTPFMGDGIVVRAQGGGTGAEGEEPGGLTFVSSGPNSGDVVTELMAQRLPARHRLPKARDYRSLAYVAFAGEAVAVALPPGAYACGVRFVRASTGQATAMVPLGTVEVG